ncbi:hypothetical protein GGR57DRAFT_425267 [Xylariaceae sp. FL1272]|nr:hypothetical protein GGR57DRAFT_425267 [Xylariaceae sp. FL1272]
MSYGIEFGFIAFVIRGVTKGYNHHWDSRPVTLGEDIVKFIQSLTEEQMQQMIWRLERIQWVDGRSPAPPGAQQRYMAAGFTDLGGYGRSPADWHCLLDHTEGARALPYILDGTLEHLIDDTNFDYNLPGFQWTYFIDFEKRELRVRVYNVAGVQYNCPFRFQDLCENSMKSLEFQLLGRQPRRPNDRVTRRRRRSFDLKAADREAE